MFNIEIKLNRISIFIFNIVVKLTNTHFRRNSQVFFFSPPKNIERYCENNKGVYFISLITGFNNVEKQARHTVYISDHTDL